MAVFLFDKIIFGPVNSRRLGVSLGINLLPNNSKLCNFNCIYCECGWTPGKQEIKQVFHPAKTVKLKLEQKLQEMLSNNKKPDVITFAGNGEPTMHPEFLTIINDTVQLRDKFFPKAKIAVLSNATLIFKNEIIEALQKVDQNILKLDSAFDKTIELLNNPRTKLSASKLINRLKVFNGNFIMQTMFVKGTYNNKIVNNTTEKEVTAWLNVVRELQPKEVMIYTIERDTPVPTLEKVTRKKLDEIAGKINELGIAVQVSE
ncbi:MAG: radical SAM protein [Chlorobi bacterium]|nr:radical SAM protein [Chlorobiota bacterium]